MEPESHKLKRWTATLYEKRWRCVLNFLKRLVPVLNIFRRCWDEHKYASNVDCHDITFKDDDAEAVEAHTAAKFDPNFLTKTILDNFFHRYSEFALVVERAPSESLAAWGESCICHEPLFVNKCFASKPMSEYQRRKLLTAHFGPGCRCCPAAGKRMAEIADGRLEHVLDLIWSDIETDILFGKVAQFHPLTFEQLEFMKLEMQRARTAMTTWLMLKLDYMQKLPWGLAVLALPDEARARIGGRRMRELFRRDPRPPPVQSRKTWALMQPGAPFAIGLDKFLDDELPRSLCGEPFRVGVGTFMLMACVETCIEEKHCRVALREKQHAIGPVQVSLSNRLPMLLGSQPWKFFLILSNVFFGVWCLLVSSRAKIMSSMSK